MRQIPPDAKKSSDSVRVLFPPCFSAGGKTAGPFAQLGCVAAPPTSLFRPEVLLPVLWRRRNLPAPDPAADRAPATAVDGGGRLAEGAR